MTSAQSSSVRPYRVSIKDFSDGLSPDGPGEDPTTGFSQGTDIARLSCIEEEMKSANADASFAAKKEKTAMKNYGVARGWAGTRIKERAPDRQARATGRAGNR